MKFPIQHYQWQLRHEYARHLDAMIKPNVAVTATLCQSRSYENTLGKTWIKGDPILYEGILTGLVSRLSEKVLGNAHKRFGKRIKAGGAVEGDGVIEAYHLHVFLHRPATISAEKFEIAIRNAWQQSPWLKPDLHIEEIHGNWVWYSVKRGPETLLFP